MKRLLVSYAYFETCYPVTLLDDGPGQGAPHDAICYILDRSHAQYLGGLSEDEKADIIARAVGPSGTNAEYLMSTLAQLTALGIDDPYLAELAERVRARLAA